MSRIVNVVLDTYSLGTGSAELEVERHKAISDLLYENTFALAANDEAAGPYHIGLSLQDDRLQLQVQCASSGHAEDIVIPLSRFRQHIQDYTLLCESFYKTARAGQIHKLEALDAGRRSIHNESAEILSEVLENKVILDKGTARRLFTLVYVLHMRHTNNLTR